MTDRIVIPPHDEPGRPFSHLLLIVEAEERWGNRARDRFRENKTGWYLQMERPLHIDRLRETFEFPPNIELWHTQDGETGVSQIVDGYPLFTISGGNPKRKLGPARPRPSLLSRLFGR